MYFAGNVEKMPISQGAKKEIKYLLNHALKFEETIIYLDRIEYEDLKILDELVINTIIADDCINEKEEEFLTNWGNYLKNAKHCSNI